LIAGQCVFLLAHPTALFPAIVDLIYCAFTNKGIRDHTMVGSSIALFTILGARAGLYAGGSPKRNRLLIVTALSATLYGHLTAGPNGVVRMALASDPPRPHLADVLACIPPNAQRCVVPRALYPGFVGRCERIDTYEAPDLEQIRIEGDTTILFVAPARLDHNVKGRVAAPPEQIRAVLGRLATQVRSGELSAEACGSMVLLRSPGQGGNPAAAEMLEYQGPGV
jgi:hypothetical protein